LKTVDFYEAKTTQSVYESGVRGIVVRHDGGSGRLCKRAGEHEGLRAWRIAERFRDDHPGRTCPQDVRNELGDDDG